jgi:signal transduction histidine kinase
MSNKRIPLRPRAHLITTLGKELISSEVVALIELVKNAYDADAERVAIVFEGPLEPGRGAIHVLDDGIGMTMETVTGAWMEPATLFKRRSGYRNTKKGRRVLGEKGIGRFASARLATELVLITRPKKGGDEITASFPWHEFDNQEKFLSDIRIPISSGKVREFTRNGRISLLRQLLKGTVPKAGTILTMKGFRTEWTEWEIDDLIRNLSRLASPYKESKDFRIYLQLPEPFESQSGEIEPPELLGRPHYTLSARVDERGFCHAKVHVLKNDRERTIEGFLKRELTEGANEWHLSTVPPGSSENEEEEEEEGVTGPRCGPFDLELRVWDRDEKGLRGLSKLLKSDVKTMRADLNRIAGVNIYRDGFRVLPYGEPHTDWLRLDLRRVNFPKKRLSNNQIVGFVRIGADSNPGLRDQSNREGLEDNAEFRDLRRILLRLISELEAERFVVRQGKDRKSPKEDGEEPSMSAAPVSDLAKSLREKYPQDKETIAQAESAEQRVEAGFERAREVIARYRRLTTLGTLIDMVLHDGRQPIHKIRQLSRLGCDIIRQDYENPDDLEPLTKKFTKIDESAGAVSTLFKRIQPLGGGRRQGRPEDSFIEEVIRSTFELMEGELQRKKVDVVLPETETNVSVDREEISQILINLLQNSLHWLMEVPPSKRKIRVNTKRPEEGVLWIDFSDSGPGVDTEIRDYIFEPFYSRKIEGTGLGLSIAGEIAEDFYDGSLELLDSGPLPGATFRVTLRKRV